MAVDAGGGGGGGTSTKAKPKPTTKKKTVYTVTKPTYETDLLARMYKPAAASTTAKRQATATSPGRAEPIERTRKLTPVYTVTKPYSTPTYGQLAAFLAKKPTTTSAAVKGALAGAAAGVSTVAKRSPAKVAYAPKSSFKVTPTVSPPPLPGIQATTVSGTTTLPTPTPLPATPLPPISTAALGTVLPSAASFTPTAPGRTLATIRSAPMAMVAPILPAVKAAIGEIIPIAAAVKAGVVAPAYRDLLTSLPGLHALTSLLQEPVEDLLAFGDEQTKRQPEFLQQAVSFLRPIAENNLRMLNLLPNNMIPQLANPAATLRQALPTTPQQAVANVATTWGNLANLATRARTGAVTAAPAPTAASTPTAAPRLPLTAMQMYPGITAGVAPATTAMLMPPAAASAPTVPAAATTPVNVADLVRGITTGYTGPVQPAVFQPTPLASNAIPASAVLKGGALPATTAPVASAPTAGGGYSGGGGYSSGGGYSGGGYSSGGGGYTSGGYSSGGGGGYPTTGTVGGGSTGGGSTGGGTAGGGSTGGGSTGGGSTGGGTAGGGTGTPVEWNGLPATYVGAFTTAFGMAPVDYYTVERGGPDQAKKDYQNLISMWQGLTDRPMLPEDMTKILAGFAAYVKTLGRTPVWSDLLNYVSLLLGANTNTNPATPSYLRMTEI